MSRAIIVIAVLCSFALVLYTTVHLSLAGLCKPANVHVFGAPAAKKPRRPDHCEYGLLAGWWDWNAVKSAGSRWQTAYPTCQLNNLVKPRPGDDRRPYGRRVDRRPVTGVLLIGDSVDVDMLKEYCGALQQQLVPELEEHKNRNVLYSCKSEGVVQRDGRTQLAMHHLLGVHPTGPYHLNETGNFVQRIAAAADGYSRAFGQKPDMVIVPSNMWDQSRM